MENLALDQDGNFCVKESVGLNYLIWFIFLALFFGVLITRNFEMNTRTGPFYMIYVLLLGPALGSFIRAKRNGFIMLVNNNGVYYYGKLITNWDNFITAYIMQEEYRVSTTSAGINDKFDIIVMVSTPAADVNYKYKLVMPGTQNKSEYEIISAIEYFSNRKLSFDIF